MMAHSEHSLQILKGATKFSPLCLVVQYSIGKVVIASVTFAAQCGQGDYTCAFMCVLN